MSDILRQQLIETAIEMNRSGLNRGRAGNLSCRCEGGMLITPTGLDYAQLMPDDIVFIDDQGEVKGSRLPSSEWRIHQDIYAARKDAGAILHAHATACTSLACLHMPIPAFHYMVAKAGGRDIPCAPYATFGSQELSDGVLEVLGERRACLMANHGLVCHEQDLEQVMDLAIEVEELARTYLLCLSVDEPVILDDEEMDRVLLKFSTYGVQND